jgi:hypothetical protein
MILARIKTTIVKYNETWKASCAKFGETKQKPPTKKIYNFGRTYSCL